MRGGIKLNEDTVWWRLAATTYQQRPVDRYPLSRINRSLQRNYWQQRTVGWTKLRQSIQITRSSKMTGDDAEADPSVNALNSLSKFTLFETKRYDLNSWTFLWMV